jgi:argininosuccinate lyase
VAGKIHTGRSRNDQVATDLRLFVKEAASDILAELRALLETLIGRAEATIEVVLPAYTHLQRAQPVLLAHWFLAYAEMVLRDLDRFSFARDQADALPLGLGSSTGAAFGIDRDLIREELGFGRLCRNSLDGVSDRDFVLDFLYAASVLFLHLSRLAEDLILWSSAEFGFVEIAEELSTGSSMMPQKRNPDSLELTRGKTGRVIGHLFGLMTVLKGLPLSYNRDLQEDKEPLFDTVDTVAAVLPVVRKIVLTLRIDRERCRQALESGFVEATAVADYLTRKGVPFRSAYRIAGKIVRDLVDTGRRSFRELRPDEWKAYSPEFAPDIADAVKIETIVAARNGIGGTAPDAVRREIKRLRDRMAGLEQGAGRP